MKRLTKACAFIDWHNTQKVAQKEISRHQDREIRDLILTIQNQIAASLSAKDSTSRYRVTLRLYHGWHIDDRPTDSRRHLERFIAKEKIERTIGRVSFTPEFLFGNELACDSHRNPIFSTSRPQGQKMVDTAIVCDLLFMLRNASTDVGIVVSNDDDFIPAILTAEAWGLDSMLLRATSNNITHVCKNDSGCPVYYWSHQ
jgi:uncharacterized LabA/DUF88 family protein